MKDNIHNTDKEQKGNPNKVYREELDKNKGGLFDTKEESDARDAAKITKAQSGRGQKIDTIDESDINDEQEENELKEREREIEEKE